jgi:hypothetical protein
MNTDKRNAIKYGLCAAGAILDFVTGHFELSAFWAAGAVYFAYTGGVFKKA